MTPEQAAWVYERVILGYHDANQANWWCDPDQSDDRLICACQLPCTWCDAGRHGICAGAKESRPHRQWRRGWGPETYLHAPGPWRPPTRKHPRWLPVWLADRVCHDLCTCTVCTTPAAPAPAPAPVAASVPTVAVGLLVMSEQLGLFEAVTV
ncbi:MAG: hypothetical protein HOY79_01855 [Streptomyces sp.]|nr:hypothetical protein [Streptomyces sp.]